MCEYQGMQDIRAIGGGGGGGGGRLFGGSGGGGGGGGADRRLRPNQANNVHGTGHPHHHHQALKCPRCDSLNTKFCYYNNYNLSQPRHFCKSCRRYWTKGGVLRNVPIGGGCRKSKRSTKPSNKHTTSASSPTDTTTAVTATATATSSATNTTPPETTPPQQNQEPISSNSHSSSESSSLTAMTNTATTAGAGNTGLEAISGHSPGNSILNGVGESKLFVHMNNSMQPGFEPSFLDQGSDCGGIFSEIGSFTNLITSTNEQMAQFGFSNLLNQHGLEQQVQQGQDQHWQQQQQQQQQEMSMKMQNMAGGGGGLIDQTVEAELSAFQSRNGCGFTSLDWQGNGDQGFFDLSSTVDPAYWSSSQSQWTNTTATTTTTDQDHQHQHHPSLYLP